VAGSILGNRVLRKEDPKFLTSGGVYVDDLLDEPLLAGAAHVTYVRSTVAHGRINSIDVSDALASPGVIAIFTAADLGLEPVPSEFNPGIARGLLAIDKVRFVGEPVAAVVTETREQGEDAAEQVIVDYETLPVVIDMEDALTNTSLLYEAAGSNVVFDSTFVGRPGVTGPAFFEGCEVVSGPHRIVNQRVAPCPLEVRGSAVAWAPDGRLHQWLSSQGVQDAKNTIVATNGVEADQVLVLTADVGGGFGAKIKCDPEEALLGVIAKKVGRPLRWQETRSESMMVLGHGRAQVQNLTVGGNPDGKITHYQLHVIQDSGYFVEYGTILAPFMTLPMASGVYDIPNIECQSTSVVTNATLTTAYRGAGRPEATAATERAMDLFAAEIGMDPAEVRRRNLIGKFSEPHTTVVGQTYDVGDYEGALDKALAAAGYTELRAEQARRRAGGGAKQLGIGVSTYVEITGGVGTGEHARIVIDEHGGATVYTGTSGHGQGHLTAWSMLAHEQTGIPMDKIDVIWGNTDLVPQGSGTSGSRSLQQGGNAVFLAAGDLVDKARSVAAKLLEADEADVVLDKATASFHVSGTPSISKSWADLAVAANGDPDLPEGLAHAAYYAVAGATFPFGAHVAIVEVDTETGQVKHLRHVACDDAGTVLNPMLLEGQIHGGVAQGTAQALMEEVRYDSDGNPVTSNLADYAFISAAELPSIEVVHMETPTFINALGAKGIGESGTIGSTPAVQSAVIDAVSHLGVTHIDMPCTPQKVWAAIQAVPA
jgi:carbon-monoxide dehydrogenase large subunit